jgi:hypothetical protein
MLVGTGLLGGCALPVSGPHNWDITSGQSDPKNLAYGLV